MGHKTKPQNYESRKGTGRESKLAGMGGSQERVGREIHDQNALCTHIELSKNKF